MVFSFVYFLVSTMGPLGGIVLGDNSSTSLGSTPELIDSGFDMDNQYRGRNLFFHILSVIHSFIFSFLTSKHLW